MERLSGRSKSWRRQETIVQVRLCGQKIVTIEHKDYVVKAAMKKNELSSAQATALGLAPK